jgi:Uma2 family endonuclease
MATIELDRPTAISEIPPPAYSAEGRRLFTVQEYLQMSENGVLRPEERTELIGGEVRQMNAMGLLHAVLVRRLTTYFNDQRGEQVIVSPQCPLQLDEHSEPEPDLVLLKWRTDEYSTSHPRGEDTLLLIEVSDSTLRYDREEKTPRYAAAGIPEVWIVDVEHQQIEQYSRPNQGRYEKSDVWKIDQEIRSLGLPQVMISVGKLFA